MRRSDIPRASNPLIQLVGLSLTHELFRPLSTMCVLFPYLAVRVEVPGTPIFYTGIPFAGYREVTTTVSWYSRKSTVLQVVL